MNFSTILAKVSRVAYNKVHSKLLHNPRWSEWADTMDELARDYYEKRENHRYSFDQNGEQWLLKTLARNNLLNVVFDVGANKGAYAEAILKCNKAALVHCFEICPPTFGKLVESMGQNPNVTINAFGLSDLEGEISVHYCPDQDTLTSSVAVVCSGDTKEVVAEVRTGKSYCYAHKIDHVDFLKIDVEGGEYAVLKGFADLLSAAKISIIQFEYGMVNIESRHLLKDFYKILTDAGYTVGKLYPDHVRFKDYEYADENFLGPNYVAVAHEHVSLFSQM